MAARNLDFFSTYLEQIAKNPPPPNQLLTIVSDNGGVIRYADLWKAAHQSGMTTGEFTEGVRELRRKGVIDLLPTGGQYPDVRLTPTGRTVASFVAKG